MAEGAGRWKTCWKGVGKVLGSCQDFVGKMLKNHFFVRKVCAVEKLCVPLGVVNWWGIPPSHVVLST